MVVNNLEAQILIPSPTNITDEGMALVKQAENTSNKKAEKKDVVTGLDQPFVRM